MFNGRLHDTKGVQAKCGAARRWSFANNRLNSFQLIADANTEAARSVQSKGIWTRYSFLNLPPGDKTVDLKETDV